MTTPLRLHTEELDTTAGELAELGQAFGHIHAELTTAWGRLDGGWHSYAREDADGYYRHAMDELAHAELMMKQMAAALRGTNGLLDEADAEAATYFKWGDTPNPTTPDGSGVDIDGDGKPDVILLPPTGGPDQSWPPKDDELCKKYPLLCQPPPSMAPAIGPVIWFAGNTIVINAGQGKPQIILNAQGEVQNGSKADNGKKKPGDGDDGSALRKFAEAVSNALKKLAEKGMPKEPVGKVTDYLPEGVKDPAAFGEKIGWGTKLSEGFSGSVARLAQLAAKGTAATAQEMAKIGVTLRIAEYWRDFYEYTSRMHPDNSTAIGRFYLMNYIADALQKK